MYILCVGGSVFECDNLLEVASHFSIEIKENGELVCEGVKDSISYEKELEHDYIVRWFIANRLTKLLSKVRLYNIKEKL